MAPENMSRQSQEADGVTPAGFFSGTHKQCSTPFLVCLLASDVGITKEGTEIKSDFKGMPALDAVLVAAAQVTSRTKSTGPRHSLA
jgi:hypothetical protein